jgi:hypothetical protein
MQILQSSLKFFDLTPAAPQLKTSASFRAAAGSVDLSNDGLASPTALAHPEVKRYWSDMFFHVFDTNKNGSVKFEDFVIGMLKSAFPWSLGYN